MVEPIGSPLKISPNPPPVKESPQPSKKVDEPPPVSKSQLAPEVQEDPVSFNADSLVESLRQEAETLKRDLPGLVKESLLAPQAQDAAQREPLNALLFRLRDPLESLLGSSDVIPKDLFTKIQDELESFKLVFPDLKNNQLLTPLLGEQANASRLDDIIGSLTAEVDGLIGNLRNI